MRHKALLLTPLQTIPLTASELTNTLLSTAFRTVKIEKCHKSAAITVTLSTQITFTTLLRMIGPKYSPGYLHWSHGCGIEISEPSGLIV